MTTTQRHTVSGKQFALELALTSLLTLVLYYHILMGMIADWELDPNYSHGFLIPFISGYLIWDRRQQLRETSLASWNQGLLILLAGLILLIVGTIGSEQFSKRLSMLIVSGGIISFLGGKKITKRLIFPISYLVFMIPIPYILYDAIAFPLKLMASKVACNILLLANIPVFRDGNIIHLANTTLEVADACSGIRSLVSLAALGVIFAYMTQKSTWKKVVLVLSTIPIAVITNICRVTGTGLLAHYISPELATGFFHSFSGWLIFIVAFTLLFAVGNLLRGTGHNPR